MTDETAPDFGAISFLVIEDDAFAQALAVDLLGQMGAKKVDVAKNGLDALGHLLPAKPPKDVLLVDLGMPDMGGAELMRHLARRKYAGAIVLVSGADEDTLTIAQELAKLRGLNILGYITKPITKEALVDALSRRHSDSK